MDTKYNESHSAQTIQLIRCPSCEKPLQTTRYKEVINETLMYVKLIKLDLTLYEKLRLMDQLCGSKSCTA